MVKDNWSSYSEQKSIEKTSSSTIQNYQTANSQATGTKILAHSAVGSAQAETNSMAQSLHPNVWGEYVSKANLIDLHFC